MECVDVWQRIMWHMVHTVHYAGPYDAELHGVESAQDQKRYFQLQALCRLGMTNRLLWGLINDDQLWRVLNKPEVGLPASLQEAPSLWSVVTAYGTYSKYGKGRLASMKQILRQDYKVYLGCIHRNVRYTRLMVPHKCFPGDGNRVQFRMTSWNHKCPSIKFPSTMRTGAFDQFARRNMSLEQLHALYRTGKVECTFATYSCRVEIIS